MSSRLTQAEDASTRLQQGVRSGLAVMIPGAWESRNRRPIVAAMETETGVPAPSSHAPGLDADRGRLERAREGGGAPSQRKAPQRTILATIWRYIIRGSDAPRR
jgi:hypothetical protein